MGTKTDAHAGRSRGGAAVAADAFGLTDIGQVRTENQDQFLIADLTKTLAVSHTSLGEQHHAEIVGARTGKLLLVADGMGGHRGGARASALAVDEVIRYVLHVMPWCYRLQESNEHDFEETLKEALLRCQQRIERKAEARPELRSMGTTLTLGYLIGPRLYVLHCGDSRCYVLRKRHLAQITTDHTVAQKLLEDGVLAPEEVRTSQYSHVLWNALGGGSSEVHPELHRLHLQDGDTVLLCTDGLTNHVDDARIGSILRKAGNAEAGCRDLVAAANDAGGSDNITVVVARLDAVGRGPGGR